MTLRNFIKGNRQEIDQIIATAQTFIPKEASCDCPKNGTNHFHHNKRQKLNDSDREEWILSDEGLYNWARSEGVRI